jgi:hypothetical protein
MPDARPVPAPRSPSPAVIVALVIATMLVTVALFVAFAPWVDPFGHSTPASEWMIYEKAAPAGSAGCRSTPREVCYDLLAGVTPSGVHLSGIQFELTNASGVTPSGRYLVPARTLGPDARVTVLGVSDRIVGSWAWTARAWAFGASWPLAAGAQFGVVLDTGLTNSSAVAGAVLYLTTTSPMLGSVGAPPFQSSGSP